MGATPVESQLTMPSLLGRLGAAFSLAVVTVVAFGVVAPEAFAASATAPVSQTSWFWREQQSNIGGTGVAPPAPAPDPTVPAGDLAVAGPTNKQGADKESYVAFDLSAIPRGSTVTSFTLTVPLDQHAHQGFLPGQLPKVVACAVVTSWAPGDGAASFNGKPQDDCTAPVVGTPAKGGNAYSFSIARIAQAWVDTDGINTGVALTDNPKNTTSAYQVVLGPTKSITASATWTAPVPIDTMPPTQGTGTSTSNTTTGTAGGGGTGSTGSGGGTGSTGGALLQPTSPGQATPPPTTAPAPQVTSPQPAPITAPLAASRNASAVPTPMFWVVAVVLAGVLAAAGLVLHDPLVTVPGGRRRGVSRALRRHTALRPSTLSVPRSST